MFVGVSTGRAGSKFIATAMNRAGIPCDHERQWRATESDWRIQWQLPAGQTGEWSAQVVPWLNERPADFWIFHQVRHPLSVVGSYLHCGLFRKPSQFGPEGNVLRIYGHITGDDPVGEACRFWLDWNEMCEEPGNRYMRWRLESVTPKLLMKAGAAVGIDVSFQRASDALQSLPNDVNTRGEYRKLTWTDIPVRWRSALQERAERYGYR